MPQMKKEDPWELIGRAIAAIDEQIADLQAKRSLLIGVSGESAPAAPAPPKRRTMSAAARARIGAATKARWARQKRVQAAAEKAKKTQQRKPATKQAKKAKPKKATPKPKRAHAKKAQAVPETTSAEA